MLKFFSTSSDNKDEKTPILTRKPETDKTDKKDKNDKLQPDAPLVKHIESPAARFERFLLPRDGSHHIQHCELKLDLYVTTREYHALQQEKPFVAMEYYKPSTIGKLIGYVTPLTFLTSDYIQLILALGLRVRENAFCNENGLVKREVSYGEKGHLMVYSPKLADGDERNQMYFELSDTISKFSQVCRNWSVCHGIIIPVCGGEWNDLLENVYSTRYWMFPSVGEK